jgi:hypothetical protein
LKEGGEERRRCPAVWGLSPRLSGKFEIQMKQKGKPRSSQLRHDGRNGTDSEDARNGTE